MTCSKLFWLAFGLAIAILFVLLPAAAAGPPLVCWPFEIGTPKSLPWQGPHWGSARTDYDLNRLVGDTLGLLAPDAPVLVQMETLRRATVYAMKEPSIAATLLARLKARAEAADAAGKPDGLAAFDYGYLVESYKQAAWNSPAMAAAARDIDGYAWVAKAIRLRGRDSEMEFAAALISVDPSRHELREHLQRALAGASEGSLLAKNLVSHSPLLRARSSTLAELRAAVASAKD